MPRTAVADDKEPDLKVSFDSRSGMTVQFKITNVGKARSSATKATLEMARGGPANPVQVAVKELQPNESVSLKYTMSFTGVCDGAIVKVEVTQKNDANPGDNELEWAACDFAPPPAQPADLELSYRGLVGTGDEKTVLFEVKNVGGITAPAGVVRIRTISPDPENPAEVPFGALGPGKIKDLTYVLAEPCDGHMIGAAIYASSDGDKNDDNNVVTATVCKKKTLADAALGTVGEARVSGIERADSTPEQLRPGSHSIIREMAEWRTIKVLHRTGNFYLCNDSGPPQAGTVGFSRANFTDANDCQNNWVYQTALAFDLADLRQHYGKLAVGRATLTWDDTKTEHMGAIVEQVDGSDRTCVDALGRPTADWRGDVDGLIPNEYFNSGNRSGTWNVTSLVLDWIPDPGAEHLGVVLKGLDESLDAEDDDTDCISIVRNPRLILDYTILE
ncbi:MAG TPA: hypothetical protein VHX16_03440 [Chloroflexota bacterium]|nr:hypothetical protein [Chloroflexota bacterium]